MKISFISPFRKLSNFTFSTCEKSAKSRFGVFDRNLIQSALPRPKNAAVYENADTIRQAATLVFGLIKITRGKAANKRTATFLMNIFLKRNGCKLKTDTPQIVEMVLAVEEDTWKVDEIENWLRQRVFKV